MTDLEKLTALLDGWDVPYVTYSDDGPVVCIGDALSTTPGEKKHNPQGCGEVGGYLGFYTLFKFDDSGSFRLVGAWE